MSIVKNRTHRAADLTKSDHGRTIRLDIEGMRTIAVGSVLAAHAGIPFLAGGFVGVDVFFVLSGFLITGLLAREVSRTGQVSLANFWGRRLKRLLPASATVLVFSAIVTYFYLPITQREVFGGDIRASALYIINWRLADRGVDYLAEDIGKSPVQHYWSLAVEEQFYLVWPILMLVIVYLANRRWKATAVAVLTIVTVASFAYSVTQTSSSPATAYFVSTTRVWELGIGALLALSAVWVHRLPERVRAIGGWVGIALIAYAVVVFDTSTTWPGVNALVPTVGAALMIASGLTRSPGSPQRFLSLPPMVWIGGLSYSIYLWHWPILIAAQAAVPDIQLHWTILLMIGSVIPAWICHTFIENPIRFGQFFKPTGRALGLGAALTALGVLAGFALATTASAGAVEKATRQQSVGAAALLDPVNADKVWSAVKEVNSIRPLPLDAPDDRPPLYDDQPECQANDGDAVPKVCEFGDPYGSRSVLIVGDSKIVQWETALDTLGKREGFKLYQITKSGCAFADAVFVNSDPPALSSNNVDCNEFGTAALADILRIKPDLVITAHRDNVAVPEGETDPADATQAAMVEGTVKRWQPIVDAGIPLVTLLDNPDPGEPPAYECVAQNPKNLDNCAFDKAAAIKASGAPAQREAAKLVPGVKVMDLTNTICPDTKKCAAVIGNVLVYRQGSHVTRTYVDSALPQLADALFKATDGKFGKKLAK